VAVPARLSVVTLGVRDMAAMRGFYKGLGWPEQAGAGEQLCQHHCPVAHVAEQFPQLCEAETEVFSRLLGKHVQRLATIAHGDGVCTTHIPGPQPVSPVSDGESARTAR